MDGNKTRIAHGHYLMKRTTETTLYEQYLDYDAYKNGEFEQERTTYLSVEKYH